MSIHRMRAAICPNEKCKTPIHFCESNVPGGVNDFGGFVVECQVCKRIFALQIKNPKDGSSVEKNGKLLDSWTDEMPAFIQEKYKIDPKTMANIETAIVFGYEKPPGFHGVLLFFPCLSQTE